MLCYRPWMVVVVVCLVATCLIVYRASSPPPCESFDDLRFGPSDTARAPGAELTPDLVVKPHTNPKFPRPNNTRPKCLERGERHEN